MVKLFNKEESEIFNKLFEKAKEDLKTWNIANVIFPFSTIAITLVLFVFSQKFPGINNLTYSEIKEASKAFVNILLNGSIPLIGLNLFVASGYFLLRFDKKREKDFGLNIFNTRVKMYIIAFVFYLLLSSLFAIQSVFSPFTGIIKNLFLLILTGVAFYVSFKISNKFFLLQEEYIDQSFGEKIATDVKTIKESLE